MADFQQMKTVLVVSSGEKSARSIAGMVSTEISAQVLTEKTGSMTRRRCNLQPFDLIIINTPLSDEFGHQLAADLAMETSAGVILIVKSDVLGEVSEMVSSSGVLTMAKPITPALFRQTIQLAIAASTRFKIWERENHKLAEKLEEARMVGRAKCLLVQYRGMSEEEAHRYIEKEAMDSRATRKKVAEEIILLY